MTKVVSEDGKVGQALGWKNPKGETVSKGSLGDPMPFPQNAQTPKKTE
jgi:hypothetical protein